MTNHPTRRGGEMLYFIKRLYWSIAGIIALGSLFIPEVETPQEKALFASALAGGIFLDILLKVLLPLWNIRKIAKRCEAPFLEFFPIYVWFLTISKRTPDFSNKISYRDWMLRFSMQSIQRTRWEHRFNPFQPKPSWLKNRETKPRNI